MQSLVQQHGYYYDISEEQILRKVEMGSSVGVVVFTRPLPRDGGIAGDHGAPEAGQLPRAWTRGRRETGSRQRASGAEYVVGQCRMR